MALVGLAAGSADGMCKVGPQACSHGLAHLAFIVFWHLLIFVDSMSNFQQFLLFLGCVLDSFGHGIRCMARHGTALPSRFRLRHSQALEAGPEARKSPAANLNMRYNG